MTQALIQLSNDSNRVLNLVKAKYDLKDKSEAVEIVIKHFVECEGEPSFQEEFIKRVEKAEKGKFVKVKNFVEHYGA